MAEIELDNLGEDRTEQEEVERAEDTSFTENTDNADYDNIRSQISSRTVYGTPIKGKRMVISIALDQPKISSSSNVNYTFPKLAPNVCVNPDSIYLYKTFVQRASNKNWLVTGL